MDIVAKSEFDKWAREYEGYNSFKITWLYDQFVHCPYKILFWDTGNKNGKTYSVAHNYVRRILGAHPIPRKNVLYFKCTNDDIESQHEFSPVDIRDYFPHVGPLTVLNSQDKASPAIPDEECPHCGAGIEEVKRHDRVFRFASGALPMQGEDTYHKKGAMLRAQSLEVKNVQHPAFKKLLPPFLLYKDCTIRTPTMVINDIYKRGLIMVEFTSYKQELVTKTGHNRLSVWGDEKMKEEEYSDAKARVVLERGDIVLTCTPIEDVSYSFYFEELFENARTYYRTKTICDWLERKYGKKYKQVEHTGSKHSIGVFRGASDDNPYIDRREIEDWDEVKRYGYMKKLSGRIFPMFDPMVHLYEDEVFDPFEKNKMVA